MIFYEGINNAVAIFYFPANCIAVMFDLSQLFDLVEFSGFF